MDHIIYGDYIVNRRSFIYCIPATPPVNAVQRGGQIRRRSWEGNYEMRGLQPGVLCPFSHGHDWFLVFGTSHNHRFDYSSTTNDASSARAVPAHKGEMTADESRHVQTRKNRKSHQSTHCWHWFCGVRRVSQLATDRRPIIECDQPIFFTSYGIKFYF